MGADNIQLGIGDLLLKIYAAGAYTSGFASPGWHSEKGMTFNAKSSDKKIKVGEP